MFGFSLGYFPDVDKTCRFFLSDPGTKFLARGLPVPKHTNSRLVSVVCSLAMVAAVSSSPVLPRNLGDKTFHVVGLTRNFSTGSEGSSRCKFVIAMTNTIIDNAIEGNEEEKLSRISGYLLFYQTLPPSSSPRKHTRVRCSTDVKWTWQVLRC
jgi:hypothetical protein